MRTPKPRPIANDDLTWYWQQSASEMGISSSWGPMVSAAQGAFGGSAAKPDSRMTDSHMRATARHRAIRKRLDALSHEHASALWHVYGGAAAPPQTVAHLGQLSNLAAHMPATREAYETDQRKAKAQKVTIKAWLALSCSSEHPALTNIITQTIEAFMAATEAWKGTRHHG